ncbi:MAG: hypothetical protein DLM72_18685 [Candidatus Nitrosopolaris wilkensis]|jgi:hypothetical protein|nr:MAG: hypothetical protein DLM72_18685 [Candidatus Nitrosopolaris wilkensis]
MLNQSNQVIVSILSAAVIILEAISSSEVGYLAYASSKEISNCPKNNSVNQATVQSASQVAIGNNI